MAPQQRAFDALPEDTRAALILAFGPDGGRVIVPRTRGRDDRAARHAAFLALWCEGVTVPEAAERSGLSLRHANRIVRAARTSGPARLRESVPGATRRSGERRATALRLIAEALARGWGEDRANRHVASYLGVSVRWVRTMRRDHERDMAARQSEAPPAVGAPGVGDVGEEGTG